MHILFLVNDWITRAFLDFEISLLAPIIQSSIPEFENCGFGRIIELNEPISLDKAVSLLKDFLKLKHCKNKNFNYLFKKINVH